MLKEIKDSVKKINLAVLKNGLLEEKIINLNNKVDNLEDCFSLNKMILSKICEIQREMAGNIYEKAQIKKEPFWKLDFTKSKTPEFDLIMVLDNIKIISGDNLQNNTHLLKEQVQNLITIIEKSNEQNKLKEYTKLIINSDFFNSINKDKKKKKKYLISGVEQFNKSSIVTYSSFNVGETFLKDLKNAETIIFNGFKGEENSIKKLDNLLNNLILDANKYYVGTTQEFRLKNIVNLVINVIDENSLNYQVIDNLSLPQVKKIFQGELLEQAGEGKLKQLKFLSKGDDLKEIRERYVDELILKIKGNLEKDKKDPTKEIEQLEINDEISKLNLKFINSLSTKLLSSELKIDKNLEKVVGKSLIEGIKQIHKLLEQAQVDLSTFDISEQARILYMARKPGAISETDASLAAKVLITQQKVLKAQSKNSQVDRS